MLIQSLREVQAEGAGESLEVYSTSPLYQATLPFTRYVGRRLEGTRAFSGLRRSITQHLIHAGKSLAITPEEFLGWMLVWSGIGALVGLYFRVMIGASGATILGLTMLCA